MNYAAILHRPISEYAFALSETRYIFRLRAARGDLRSCGFSYADRAAMTPSLSFAFLPMKRVMSNLLYDVFQVEIDTPYTRIAYYFTLCDGERTVYYLGNAFETSADQPRSDYFQLPANLRSDRMETPLWAREAVVYNIFPDSFASSRRALTGRGVRRVYDGQVSVSRLGGTIAGVTDNLDYIADAGFTCIYLNPVFAANSYHKYDLLDYYHVDPCLGTDAEFGALVKRAHALHLRVVIDGVFNHVGAGHFFFRDVLKNGRGSPYYAWFYDVPVPASLPQNGEAPRYACFSYVPEMPKLDTANPAVTEYFTDVGAYWVRRFDVDGWRLDVANEVSDSFLRAFRSAVKREKKDALIIGEVWENASHFLNGDMLDSAMNYDFRRFCRGFFAEETLDAPQFDLRVGELLTRYKTPAVSVQLNLLDSHDVSRFLTLCRENPQRFELAVLFQMTFPGIPSVFYGDEKGLTGSGEEEYRQNMPWDRESPFEMMYRRFIALRKAHRALSIGDYQTVLARGGLYAYRRAFGEIAVLIYLNAGAAAEKICPSGEILLQKGYEDGILFAYGYVIFNL